MRVLYVTDTRHGRDAWHDPSARHRCYHFADALNQQPGCVADVANIRNVGRVLAGSYDHVVFHRPKNTSRFRTAFKAAQSAGCVLHADYDDVIFEPELAEWSPMFINGNRPLPAVKKYFRDNHEALACFDNILVSTRALAGRIKSVNALASISVLPNSLPRLFQPPVIKPVRVGSFTIGYFPGSNSHGHDFENIQQQLMEILASHRDSRLLVAGRLSLDRKLENHRSVFSVPFCNYNRYLELLANVSVSIAPLEKNLFNNCKSAVKLIESCAVDTPIIASAIDDMIDHYNPLSRLIDDGGQWFHEIDAEKEKQSQRRQTRIGTSPVSLAYTNRIADRLSVRFGVVSRLPILLRHLEATAKTLPVNPVTNCV